MVRHPFPSVDELLDALGSLDGRPSDDIVPTLPHLLQTAETLAANHADDPELIAAGLVHDLASALESDGGDHAQHGAALVAPLLGKRVAQLVAGHTDAKRYLVTVDDGYLTTLSPNSTHTLDLQGGPMTADELAAFTERPHWQTMLVLRRADDRAKIPDRVVRPVESWRSLLEEVATLTRREAAPVPRLSPGPRRG